MKLTLQSIIKKTNKELISSKMGEEVMAMDLNSGNYIHFNEVGATIWEYLNETTTLGALIDKLVAEYNISKETCQADVEQYIKHLVSINLVSIE